MAHVYFIQAGVNGPIKIGYAFDPRKRMIGLQIAHWEKLLLLGVIPGSEIQEHRLHRAFKEDHLRGEWFRASDTLLNFIASNSEPFIQWKDRRFKENRVAGVGGLSEKAL